jgi:two-component system phosphate regulon sensor histidine kinase PhoR
VTRQPAPAPPAGAGAPADLPTARPVAGTLPADLLTELSHELRTPLASILGYAELLTDEGGLDPATARMVHTIRRNAARLARVLDNVAALADLDRGDIPRHREPVDVGELLAALPTELAHDLNQHQVALVVNTAPLPTVAADAGYLQQALVELTLDVVEAGNPGGTVDIAASARPGEVVVAIVAGGNRAAAGPASAIGLAVARGIVERHGGWLDRAGRAPDGTSDGSTRDTRTVVHLPTHTP